MNKRIEELAKQTLSKDQFGLWLAGDPDLEKFAELIIKEYSSFITDNNLAGPAVVLLAEKHFGVK